MHLSNGYNTKLKLKSKIQSYSKYRNEHFRLDARLTNSLNELAEKVKQEVIQEGLCKFQFSDVELSLDLNEFGSITDHLSQQFLDPILEAGRIALIDWGSV